MFKTLLLSARRLLPPRPLSWPSVTLDPPAPDTGYITIYDIRRNGHIVRSLSPATSSQRPSLLGGQSPLTNDNNHRWASSTMKGIEMPNPSVVVCNTINMLKCVDLNDLKDAPPPAFWPGLTVGGLQLAIPLLELLAGYSPVLTMYQLYSAAITVAFFSGKKWGLALSDNKEPKADWDTMVVALSPTAAALLGLLTPYPLGFLIVGSSLFASLYLNLKACIYPPWACALLVFICFTTAVGLLLALSAYVLFHNNANKKNKIEEGRKEGKGVDKEQIDEKDQKP